MGQEHLFPDVQQVARRIHGVRPGLDQRAAFRGAEFSDPDLMRVTGDSLGMRARQKQKVPAVGKEGGPPVSRLTTVGVDLGDGR